MEIPFVQYLLPNGRRIIRSIEKYGEIAEKAQEIINRGLYFEAEVLATGEISLTIAHEKEGDLAIEICRNGPDVPKAVDKLIKDFPLDRTSLPWSEPSG